MALIQQSAFTKTGAGTNATPSLTGVVAGHSLVLSIAGGGMADSLPTDSSGQTWQKANFNTSGTVNNACYWLPSANAGTHSLTWPLGSNPDVGVCGLLVEIPACSAVDVIGTPVTGTGTSTSSFPSITVTAADALFAMVSLNCATGSANNHCSNPPSLWTAGTAQTNTFINYGVGIAYRETTGPDVTGAVFSYDSDSMIDRMAMIVSLKFASGGTDVTPGPGTVAFTGYAPTIGQPHGVAPAVDVIAFTGFAPVVGQPHATAPAVGALALQGFAPTVGQSHGTQPTAGGLTFTGYAPTVTQGAGVVPGTGTVALVGYAPTVFRGDAHAVAPAAGALTFVGYAPTVTQGVAPEATRFGGFEMGGPREVSFKPLSQRILEARAERRVKPAKERAAKRAKAIEVEAAFVALDTGNEARFQTLMAQWLAQRPVLPQAVEPSALFLAQVLFRIQQMQAEEALRARLRAQRDEEEALIALLLA